MLTNNRWYPVSPQNPYVMAFYSRHYSSRGRKRSGGMMPPGEQVTLMLQDGTAIFGWNKQHLSKRADGQDGVNCTVFRNESKHLSSDLIRDAMELAWQKWPGERLWTYVDPAKVKSSNPGYCFQMAGWTHCGQSKKGLLIFEVMPNS